MVTQMTTANPGAEARRTVSLRNGRAIAASDTPIVDVSTFRQAIVGDVERGARLLAWYARPPQDGKQSIVAVLGRDDSGVLHAVGCTVDDSTYPSLTPECPQAHWFERELCERWGIVPQGHPWLKPVRFPRADRVDPRASEVAFEGFFRVEGAEVHEVGVGPVHAGIIEPGHFRFQCHGERVLHLEISLGYQHRGIERALVEQPVKRHLPYVETCAGDTTVGHATAYCQAAEAVSGVRVPARALALRGIALELERIANHVGDLGALSGDVAYLPTASYCGRIRGDVLNMTALVCGNRFGRGWIRVGGVGYDVTDAMAKELLRRLDVLRSDLSVAVEPLWDTPSVLARFEATGRLSRAACNDIGLVGPAARAAGIERDVRQDYAFGIYRVSQLPVSTWSSGDVYGRAFVRWLEIQRSIGFLVEQLRSLPAGNVRSPAGPPAPGRLAVSLVEAWRGEIVHVLETAQDGRNGTYKIVDPSFHNWFGLAMAMRGQPISDFPLCNKSFNLSYCGHDL